MTGFLGRGKGDSPGELWSGGDRTISGPGALRVNSHWELAAPSGGPVRAPVFDVDLGALYELSDRTRGVVQALGGLRGAFERPPYVAHDQDDRAGSAAGENIFVNLEHVSALRRVLFFVYSHNGPLANARPTVTFFPPQERPFRVPLDHIPAEAHACAVAMLTPSGGQWTVRREVRFVPGFQADIDRAYGFGLRWGRQDKPGL